MDEKILKDMEQANEKRDEREKNLIIKKREVLYIINMID